MSLEAADRILAATFKTLWTEETKKRTFVVVTSDHGEGLGDHGARFHSTTLYNSEIRVPLVVAGPGIAAKRVKQPVGLVDLAPTLLDLAGFVPPGMPQMDGVSLAPILRGEEPAKVDNGEAYSVMLADRSVSRTIRALVAGRYKLIEEEGRSPELYNLLRDKKEKRNLAKEKPEILREMQERMAARRANDAIPPF